MTEKRKILGKDLRLVFDEEGADLTVSPRGDLATTIYEDNLGQAMVNRLRTRIGELRELGHGQLGSRLYSFVGEPNNLSTREQVKTVVRDALAQEARIREVVRVEVKPNKEQRDRLDIEVAVIPIGEQAPLNIVMPFYLELA